MTTLKIVDLHAEIEGQKILNGINLKISSGEIHAIMGPNGSGKSTLCKILMGHPAYEVLQGQITLDDQDITELEPNERANLGLFLGFQQPLEIPGVTMSNFLRLAKNANLKANKKEGEQKSPQEFLKELKTLAAELKMDEKFIGRSVNENFSGGERKRAEIIQMRALKPKIAMLDEIDSGLDIDALKIVAEGVNNSFSEQQMGLLLITHYQRLLNYIEPRFVHVMADGKIIKSGGKELAQELEKDGYDQFTRV